jgi:hypothetical protein
VFAVAVAVADGSTAPTTPVGVARVGLATVPLVAAGVGASGVSVAGASAAVAVTVGKATASAVGVVAAPVTAVGDGDDDGDRNAKASAPMKTSRLTISAIMGSIRRFMALLLTFLAVCAGQAQFPNGEYTRMVPNVQAPPDATMHRPRWMSHVVLQSSHEQTETPHPRDTAPRRY